MFWGSPPPPPKHEDGQGQAVCLRTYALLPTLPISCAKTDFPLYDTWWLSTLLNAHVKCNVDETGDDIFL